MSLNSFSNLSILGFKHLDIVAVEANHMVTGSPVEDRLEAGSLGVGSLEEACLVVAYLGVGCSDRSTFVVGGKG